MAVPTKISDFSVQCLVFCFTFQLKSLSDNLVIFFDDIQWNNEYYSPTKCRSCEKITSFMKTTLNSPWDLLQLCIATKSRLRVYCLFCYSFPFLIFFLVFSLRENLQVQKKICEAQQKIWRFYQKVHKPNWRYFINPNVILISLYNPFIFTEFNL